MCSSSEPLAVAFPALQVLSLGIPNSASTYTASLARLIRPKGKMWEFPIREHRGLKRGVDADQDRFGREDWWGSWSSALGRCEASKSWRHFSL
ncbi:hypothetical protein DL98DRAFT_239339 [Cadophora sp. DSE1049]|nr:hypothetical protein DL98DRAFT_239339 [Cadophora sp. DSE1049]